MKFTPLKKIVSRLILASGIATVGEVSITVTLPSSKAERIIELQKETLTSQELVAPATTAQIILLRQKNRGLPKPNALALPQRSNEELLPLGGIARARTIFCREQGELITYKADRYGFRNRDSLWDGTLDYAVVGDSYAQGACVGEEDHLVAHLQRFSPRTLNLGSFGNGPLANLATIHEYILSREDLPGTVLWFYVPNDIVIDLLMEKQNEILRSYLEQPTFSQQLISRQPEIDERLGAFLQAETQRLALETSRYNAMRIITLYETRRLFHRTWQRLMDPPPPNQPAVFDYDRTAVADYQLHARIVSAAASRLRARGSELVFVIVPDARWFRVDEQSRQQVATHAAKLQRSLKLHGISVIDLSAGIAAKYGENPHRAYTRLAGYYGHFHEQGYAAAAAVLVDNLRIKHKQHL